MDRTFRLFLIALIYSNVLFSQLGCSYNAGGHSTTFDATWITATWTDGAAGEPTDRTDTDSDNYLGNMCDADTADLTNYGDEFQGLSIVNNCSNAVTYYLCAASGSSEQPEGGLQECENDPIETPVSQLRKVTLTSDAPSDDINSTQELSVHIFYCGSVQELVGTPLHCL